MQIKVTASSDEEEFLEVKMSIFEGQVLKAMIGKYRNDIDLLAQWKSELDDAGVENPNFTTAALTMEPILFFSDPE